MLKWLVTRGPSDGLNDLGHVVTDDPLATISRGSRKSDPVYAVSRVNPLFEEDHTGKTNVRANFAHEESELKKENSSAENETTEFPESPPTDRESIRSSGYGSKETDSVSYKSDSQEDEDYPDHNETSDNKIEISKEKFPAQPNSEINSASTGSVAALRRSFESLSGSQNSGHIPNQQQTNQIEILQQNADFVKSIEIVNHRLPGSTLEVIPEVNESLENSPSKTSRMKLNSLSKDLQRQEERGHQRREREMLKPKRSENAEGVSNNSNSTLNNPLISVVVQDERYVTSISVSPNGKLNEESHTSSHLSESNYSTGFPQPEITISMNEGTVPSYFQRSNPVESNEYPLLSLQPDSLINEDTLKMMNYPHIDHNLKNYEYPHDSVYKISPRDMPDFGRAIYSGLYSTNRNGSSASQESIGRRTRTYIKHSNQVHSAKKKGVNVVKDLWQKSGLKTNGRKLLVDVSDVLDEDRTSLSGSRKSSYGSAEEFRSMHSTFGNGGSSQYQRLSSITNSSSNRSSNMYEEVSSYPHHSSSGTYEEIPENERGIDNPAFTDDRGQSTRDSITSSIHSKSGFQFQHNLTDFPKRVSDKLQAEPSHRKSWLDVEKGIDIGDPPLHDTLNTFSGAKFKKKNIKESKKSKNFPGKAVREFGLDGRYRTRHDWKSGNENDAGRTNSWTSRQELFSSHSGHWNSQDDHFWKKYLGSSQEANLSGYFSPHPNSEAVFCGRGGDELCQDFTLDAGRSQRIQQRSSRSEKRKRLCSVVIVLAAFFFFIVVIIGVSWYYTGGQRVFGPM